MPDPEPDDDAPSALAGAADALLLQLYERLGETNRLSAELEGTKAEAEDTKAKLDTAKVKLDTTKAKLEHTKAELENTKAELARLDEPESDEIEFYEPASKERPWKRKRG